MEVMSRNSLLSSKAAFSIYHFLKMDGEPEHVFTFDKEFHDIVSNKDVLRRTTEKFLNNLIDDITLDRDDSPSELEDNLPNVDIFGQHNMKKTQECVCPNCDRAVAAARFAPHLEACMGMGRSRSRNARRVVNNSKDRENSSYSGITSDDEDDAGWSSGEKRSRKKKDRNGNKKGKGTPKKSNEPESLENVDVEGDEDGDLASLRDMLQEHSNGSSPVDSSSNLRKRDKSKNKKSGKRDRNSPNVSSLPD